MVAFEKRVMVGILRLKARILLQGKSRREVGENSRGGKSVDIMEVVSFQSVEPFNHLVIIKSKTLSVGEAF